MDDTTLVKLSEINEALVEHLQWLLGKRDLDSLSALVPVVDKLTTILLQARQEETVSSPTPAQIK